MKWTFNGKEVRFIESTQAVVLYLAFGFLFIGGLMVAAALTVK